MSVPAVPSPSRAELLRQYEVAIDLYKHYLKLVIELNVFYYAITGAIVSYYFAHQSQSTPYMRYALLLPFLMSLLFAGLFTYGAILQRSFRLEIFNIRDALGFRVAPETQVLSVFLYVSAVLMSVVAIGLAVLMGGCHVA